MAGCVHVSFSLSLPPTDPPCSLWSAVHSEPDWHFSLPWCTETQLIPPVSRSYCSAATVESYICHERSQPEVIEQVTDKVYITGNLSSPLIVFMYMVFLPRLLSQCTEYFDLRCQLLDDLTSKPIKSNLSHQNKYTHAVKTNILLVKTNN